MTPATPRPGPMIPRDPGGTMVWFTGLPSSGKTTLARAVRTRLAKAGRPCALLDGDEVRAALLPRPGYDATARAAFYGSLTRLAALLARQGLVVLVAATAHRRAFRDEAREFASRFVEVHLAVSPDVCAARDGKGLYAGARRGEIKELPGHAIDYEAPASPEVIASGGEDPAAIERIIALVT